VVNKPNGMVCFHSRKTTDGKIGRKKKYEKKNRKGYLKKETSTVTFRWKMF
jgi:hypothetical protein